jgi:signal transduction histidine kinase
VVLMTDQVTLSPEEGGVSAIRLRVRDEGEGVPEAELETIFDRFVQSSGNGSPGGTGLGLAIAREIVIAHGGTISATNRDGGGACFTVLLPRSRP